MLPLPPGRTPRDWQLRALEAARAGIATYDAVIISAATGTGKGSLIAGIAILCAQRGGRVLAMAHRDELVAELEDRVRQVRGAPAVGVAQGKRNELLNPIVVASVQSLTAKRRAQLGKFDLVLTDECHHATAPIYGKVYDAVAAASPNWKHLGFTATAFRSAKGGGTTGLGKVFQAVFFEYSITDAIANGDLVPVRGYEVSTQVTLEGVRIGADGDFVEEDLAALVDTPDRNKLVAAEYLARCAGKPALVFCASIEHAKHMAEAFVASGVQAKAVWGDSPDRAKIIRLYRERPDVLPVLCSKDLIFEGFDAPATAAVLKARPTKSRVIFTQMVGRGLRLHPESGKEECLFLDFVDNGCELDLASISDLTSDDGGERAGRPLVASDRVRRRHHDDWGTGIVAGVEEGEVRLVTVRWPVTRVHPDGEELQHPAIELKRAAPEETPEPEVVRIAPKVAGVQVYEVFLLPGQSASSKSAVGWYEYSGAWTASGRLPDDGQLTMHVLAGDGRWEVWGIRAPPRDRRGFDEDVVTMLHTSASSEGAIAWGIAHLKSQNAKVSPISADWKTQPATEPQVNALKRWGIRRDLSQISRGEASALLDSVVARNKVRQAARRRARGAA